MRIKALLIIMSVLIVATLFAGCGNSQPEKSKNSGASGENNSDAVTSAEAYTEPVTDVEAELTTDYFTIINVPTEAETFSVPDTEISENTTSQPLTEAIYNEPHINFSDFE